jgi:hypothetical protein
MFQTNNRIVLEYFSLESSPLPGSFTLLHNKFWLYGIDYSCDILSKVVTCNLRKHLPDRNKWMTAMIYEQNDFILSFPSACSVVDLSLLLSLYQFDCSTKDK